MERLPASEALDDTFLDALVTEFADAPVHSVALTGSHARGDADAFSGVDLVCFVQVAASWRETAARLRPILTAGHREVVEVAIDVAAV